MTFAAFLGGAIAGYALAIIAYVALTSADILFDRDGGIAMAFAFTIGPVLALACGVGSAIVFRRRTR